MTSAERQRRTRVGLVGLAISVSVFVVVLAFRSAGLLEFAELRVYDSMVRLRAPQSPDLESPVVVIGITDADTEKYTFPIPDQHLTTGLEKILEAAPIAIGLDLYRDRPQPQVEGDPNAIPEWRQELDSVLLENPEIVVIALAGEEASVVKTPPPRSLYGRPSQVGFNNLATDSDRVLRRCLWSQEGAEVVKSSLSFRLAQRYLYSKDVSPKRDDRDPQVTIFGKARIVPLRADSGPYATLSSRDVAGYQFLLDYRGPRQFLTYSFDDLMAGRVPASAMTGKVVLIGTNEDTNNDRFRTPTGAVIYGVNAHATIVDQFIRSALQEQGLLRFLPTWANAGLSLLLGVVGAGLALVVRRPVFLVAALAAVTMLLAAVSMEAFRRDVWVPLVPPVATCLGTGFLTIAYVSQRDRRDREGLLRLFGGYVDPMVAREIWESRDAVWRDENSPDAFGALRSQRLVATVLFTDLKGFSSMSEKADPQKLVPWLNAYLEAMASAVRTNGGMVNKYIGDAVMAVFGVPVPRADEAGQRKDAINAVRAALAMRRELIRLNATWEAAGQATATMRVGIHTGPLVAGGIGGKDRFEYTVIGDTVNVAARLEQHDKQYMPTDIAAGRCRILIGPETARLVADEFELLPAGQNEVHGRKSEVKMYGVVGEKNAQQTTATLTERNFR